MNNARVWRFAVMGWEFSDFRVVSRYYVTRRGAEKWLEKHTGKSGVGVYLIQAVNISAWKAAQK